MTILLTVIHILVMIVILLLVAMSHAVVIFLVFVYNTLTGRLRKK